MKTAIANVFSYPQKKDKPAAREGAIATSPLVKIVSDAKRDAVLKNALQPVGRIACCGLLLACSVLPLLQESQTFGLIEVFQQFGVHRHRLQGRAQLLVQFCRGRRAGDITAYGE